MCYNCGKPGHIAQDYRGPRNYNSAPNFANVVQCFKTALSEWYMDNGATTHVAGDYHNFEYIHPSSSIQEVRIAGGETHGIEGLGSSTVKTKTGEIKLINVKYVPSLTKNLVSVGAIADRGNLVVFTHNHCFVLDGQKS
jgi:hypothetical protein